ncbi:MAG: AMP-binding protein [Legionella sp.]|nr:AMP-binding protein [Legionella sp.]
MYTLFSQSEKSHPHNSAFILSNEQRLSYSQASQIVDNWVSFFQHHQIKKGDKVAVFTKQEDLYPFLHLALDKLNATIVPLDTDTPIDVINHLDFIQKLLIDEETSAKTILQNKILLPILEGVKPPFSSPEEEMTPITRDDSIPNYIVASSGTSSRKKWIPILTPGLTEWGRIEKETLLLNETDKILCTRSPGYDARISEYVRTFAAAATLVLMPQAFRKNLLEIVSTCERERITCLILIASQLNTPNLESLITTFKKAGLKHLMVTGDACSLALKKLCEKYDIKLWNCYGPTEATFGMSILCVNHLEVKDEMGQEIVPIGKPNSPHVHYHLIDDCLYIDSPFLSPGYLNDAEKTLQNFPIVTINGREARLFNTENQFSVNGNLLIFKGRIDANAHCKISGEKIDPFAIQQTIEQYNDFVGKRVCHAFVVIKKWRDELKPVAYMVVHETFSVSAFQTYLLARFRKAEIPICISLSALPLLQTSEKIDKQSLITREDKECELLFHQTQENPDDALWYRLNRIITRVLTLKEIPPDLDLIFLGADSGKIFEIYTKIKEEICNSLSYADLMNLPKTSLEEIYRAIKENFKTRSHKAIIKNLTQIDNDNPNYFFLPPLLGEGPNTYSGISYVFHLFRERKINIYALSHPGLYDFACLPQSMEEAVDCYVHSILDIQPEGKFNLLGFSYGTNLAYYVAQKLIDLGFHVAQIELVDGMPPFLYQHLLPADFSIILMELADFVIDILNKNYYQENLNPISLLLQESSIEPLSKLPIFEQINTVFDLMLAQTQHAQARPLLELARRHLIYAQQSPPPHRLNIQTYLYFSDRTQTYLSIINKIPNIEQMTVSKIFYFWDLYFSHIQYGSFRKAKLNHLDLIKKEGRSFSNLARFWQTPYVRDVRGFLPFYTLSEENSQEIRVTIYGALDKKHGLNLPLPNIQINNYQTQFLCDHIRYLVRDTDTCYSAIYVWSFTAPKAASGEFDRFFSEKNIRAQHALGLDENPKETSLVCTITLKVLWNRSPLVALSFYTKTLSTTHLDELISNYQLHLKDINHELFLVKDYIVLAHPSTSYAMAEASKLINAFVLALSPHSVLRTKHENSDNQFSKDTLSAKTPGLVG